RKRDTAIIFGKLRATSTSDTEQLSEIQLPPEFSEIQRPPEFSEIQNTDEGTFGIASNSWRQIRVLLEFSTKRISLSP
ncbi:hypothetical protein AVEN_78270-1, partial [Araneus ventricosus]